MRHPKVVIRGVTELGCRAETRINLSRRTIVKGASKMLAVRNAKAHGKNWQHSCSMLIA